MIEQVEKYLKNLQNDICDEFGSLDSKSSFDKIPGREMMDEEEG